jgi:hypothetical protein
MHSIAQIIEFFLHELGIVSIKDSIEILVISAGIYYFLRWIEKDKQKNLLFFVYGYYTTYLLVQYSALTTLSTLLMYTIPSTLVLCIILHQETLQRNSIVFKKEPKQAQESGFWLDEFIKLCLSALNNKKELLFVLERTDSLQELITTPGMFYADIKKETAELLFEKQYCDGQKFIWLQQEGKLLSINAQWKLTHYQDWINDDIRTLARWKQDALFITAKTDALIIKINSISRSFDIISNGILYEHNDAQQTAVLLRKHLVQTLKDTTCYVPAKGV